MANKTERFLRLLWPHDLPPGLFTLWKLSNRRSVHLEGLLTAAAQALVWDQQQQDVYFGVGLRKPVLLGKVYSLGREEDIAAWPGFWFDLDIRRPGAHAQEALPPDLDAAVEILDAFPISPTLLVDSGFGLHVYWLFHKPFVCDEGYEQFKRTLVAMQRCLRELGEARGFTLDDTAKTQQVLRLPGTHNYKLASDVRRVSILLDDGPRCTLEEMQRLVLRGRGRPRTHTPPRPAAGPETEGPPQPSDDETAGGEGGTLEEGADPEWICECRRRLKRLTNEDNRALAAKLLKGKSFASQGTRNVTANRLVGVIVYVVYRVKPDAIPDEIYAAFFRASIEVMATEDRFEPLTETQILDQIRRALENVEHDTEVQKEAEQRLAEALFRIANRKGKGSEENGSSGGANGHGGGNVGGESGGGGGPVDPGRTFTDMSPEDQERVLRLLVVQHQTAFYIMRDDRYQPPITKESLEIKLRDDFEGVDAVRWYYEDQNGNAKKKTLQYFLNDYATASRHLVYDLTIEESYYEIETETFFEAVCPLRDLEPRFDDAIHEWLQLFGGEEAYNLIDWISTITELEHQTCAIYAHGPSGTGKTLLAQGLARLWVRDQATEFDQALSHFNSDLIHCPLVVADEHASAAKTTAEIRQLIGTDRRTISRKFLPNAKLKGSLRLMLLANNDRLLQLGNEDLGAFDLAATAERFLHIVTPQAAADFLKEIGGREGGTKAWVDDDLIARHALWLRDHKRPEYRRDSRWLVVGHQTSMHHRLLFQGTAVPLVIEWLVRFLSRPQQLPNVLQNGTVRCGQGELLVNTSAITDHWDAFINSHTVFSTTRVGRALAQISSGIKRVHNKNYWSIKSELLSAWAEENNVGDTEHMSGLIHASDLLSTVSLKH